LLLSYRSVIILWEYYLSLYPEGRCVTYRLVGLH
jgi:hypothetical protein